MPTNSLQETNFDGVCESERNYDLKNLSSTWLQNGLYRV